MSTAVPESTSAPKGESTTHTLDDHNYIKVMKDVYLWRRWQVSATLLLVSTALWVVMQVYHFNFVTVSSWLAMLLVSSLFIYGNILRLLRKEEADMSWLQVPEKTAMRVANCVKQWGEEGVRWMFRVGAEKEWFVFVATVAALWLLSVIGNCSDLLTLLYFGNVVGMVVPVVYVRYEEKIKEYRERVKMQGKRLYGMLDEKVIRKLKNKAVAAPAPPKKEKKAE